MRRRPPRESDNVLSRCIIGLAVCLGMLFGILAYIWDPAGSVAAFPWYVPMVDGFGGLAAFSVAFLALGRYQVRREPSYLWIATAFGAYAILALFYVLSWPGLLSNERGILSSLPSTSAWLRTLKFSALAGFLLGAVLVRRPRAATPVTQRKPLVALAAALLVASVGWLSLVYERLLPPMMVDSRWTPVQVGWLSALLATFAAGTVLSARRHRQTHDPIFAYMSIAQLVLAFAMLSAVIGGARYDQWWYLQRMMWIAAFSVMLFGLLHDFAGLYRREAERTRELEALQQVTDPILATQGLEPLLHSLLERATAVVGANSAAILVFDRVTKGVVLRSSVGAPAGLADLATGDWGAQRARNGTVEQIPIRLGEETIGVMRAGFSESRSLAPHEELLLEVVAERAALAIRQAQLLEEAERERNRLRALIDIAPVGITFHSALDGHMVISNRAAEAIAGRPIAPDIGAARVASYYGVYRPSGEPCAPEDLPASRSLNGEVCVGVEMQVRQPSGRRVSILANSAPLRDPEGMIVGAVVAFQDITIIRDQERLRDEFISAAAHELKTPVTTIKGYAQLMLQWTPGGHEPREGKAFEVINAQADRITSRVQEMLRAVRLQLPALEMHRVRFDLGDLAADVLQRLRAVAKPERLILQRDALVPVDADPQRIEEVFVSLLNNAIECSRERGGTVDVRVWTHGTEALASVKDRGTGIQRERQQNIFEPFYEAAPAGTPGYRGVVALGLYLSRLIIERHGGRIWLESEEGKGSTFCFSLPLAEVRGGTHGQDSAGGRRRRCAAGDGEDTSGGGGLSGNHGCRGT